MDKNQERCQLRKAQILGNINSSISGGSNQSDERITYEEFSERMEKGEKFYTEENVANFQKNLKKGITAAYTNDEKESLQKSADSQLDMLKAVTVVTELGREFTFYTAGLEKSE